jgi:hypothetical protein
VRLFSRISFFTLFFSFVVCSFLFLVRKSLAMRRFGVPVEATTDVGFADSAASTISGDMLTGSAALVSSGVSGGFLTTSDLDVLLPADKRSELCRFIFDSYMETMESYTVETGEGFFDNFVPGKLDMTLRVVGKICESYYENRMHLSELKVFTGYYSGNALDEIFILKALNLIGFDGVQRIILVDRLYGTSFDEGIMAKFIKDKIESIFGSAGIRFIPSVAEYATLCVSDNSYKGDVFFMANAGGTYSDYDWRYINGWVANNNAQIFKETFGPYLLFCSDLKGWDKFISEYVKFDSNILTLYSSSPVPIMIDNLARDTFFNLKRGLEEVLSRLRVVLEGRKWEFDRFEAKEIGNLPIDRRRLFEKIILMVLCSDKSLYYPFSSQEVVLEKLRKVYRLLGGGFDFERDLFEMLYEGDDPEEYPRQDFKLMNNIFRLHFEIEDFPDVDSVGNILFEIVRNRYFDDWIRYRAAEMFFEFKKRYDLRDGGWEGFLRELVRSDRLFFDEKNLLSIILASNYHS